MTGVSGQGNVLFLFQAPELLGFAAPISAPAFAKREDNGS
jgi:hypothetical protein